MDEEYDGVNYEGDGMGGIGGGGGEQSDKPPVKPRKSLKGTEKQWVRAQLEAAHDMNKVTAEELEDAFRAKFPKRPVGHLTKTQLDTIRDKIKKEGKEERLHAMAVGVVHDDDEDVLPPPAKIARVDPHISSAGVQAIIAANADVLAAARTRLAAYNLLGGGMTDESRELVQAVMDDDLEKVKDMVSAGGDVRCAHFRAKEVETSGWTALHFAADRASVEVIEYLLEHGAELESRSSEGETPFAVACNSEEPRIPVLQYLLSKGADIDAVDNYGRSPIFPICAYGYAEALQFLLEQGADANLQDNDGMTPLHMAALEDQRDAVTLLLAHGVDLNQVNDMGELALDLDTSDEIKQAIVAEEDRRRSEGLLE